MGEESHCTRCYGCTVPAHENMNIKQSFNCNPDWLLHTLYVRDKLHSSEGLDWKNKDMAAQVIQDSCRDGCIETEPHKRSVASSARLNNSFDDVDSPSVESGARASITAALFNGWTNKISC